MNDKIVNKINTHTTNYNRNISNSINNTNYINTNYGICN